MPGTEGWFRGQLDMKLVYLVLIAVVVVLNLVTRGFGLDLVILVFGAVAAFKGRGREFLQDWAPFLVLFWAYESLRGVADTLMNRPVYVNIFVDLESVLFGTVLPVYLQHIFPVDHLPYALVALMFFIYSTFYWFWAGIGFLLWLSDRKNAKRYLWGLLAVSFTAAVFYVLFPSAPPWYAASKGLLPPLSRFLWGRLVPNKGLSFVHFWDQNYFAAFPSLHVAWPFYAALWSLKCFKSKLKYLAGLVPFFIWFVVIYGAEHYFLDGLFGVFLASLGFVVFGYNWKCRE